VEADVYVWCYSLPVVHARKEEEEAFLSIVTQSTHTNHEKPTTTTHLILIHHWIPQGRDDALLHRFFDVRPVVGHEPTVFDFTLINDETWQEVNPNNLYSVYCCSSDLKPSPFLHLLTSN